MEQNYNVNDWTEPCPKYDCRKAACKCGLKYVNIPMSLGDDSAESSVAPKNGAYCNALVFYEANGHVYIYSQEGVPTLIDVDASDISTLEQEVIKAQKDVHELREDIDDFIYGFDTVAQMKAATNLSSGDRVRTLGYYAKSDGGGAFYKVTNIQPSGHYEMLSGFLYAELIIDEYVTPEMFGAYGDGSHDDSSVLQSVINMGIPVEFSPKTYICFSLEITHPAILHGNGATLKRPELDIAPYNMTVAQMKWVRTITVHEDAEIDGFTFDNNCFTMWQVSDGYAQEQSASVIVSHSSKKIKFSISNCLFKNSAGDGLHVVTNVEAFINNCRSEDCFRGGFVSTGRGSDINLNGWNSKSITKGMDDGFDVEVDSASSIDSTYKININNVILDYDLDIGIPDGGIGNLDNVIMRLYDQDNTGGPHFSSRGTLNISNSLIRSGTVANLQTVINGGTIKFDNVKFIGNTTDPVFKLSQLSPTSTGSLGFYNCTAQCYRFIVSGTMKSYITLSNCDINCSDSFYAGITNQSPQPKRLYLLNSHISFGNRLLDFVKNSFAQDNEASIYMYGNNFEGASDGINEIHLTGTPKIYFDSTPTTGGYNLTLGAGATPSFYGKNRVIIVPTSSVLTFRGFVPGEDIAIAEDTGIKYQYTSGTTWTQI